MALPPPNRVEMGAFYRVLKPMELSAALGYTTRAADDGVVDVPQPFMGRLVARQLMRNALLDRPLSYP